MNKKHLAAMTVIGLTACSPSPDVARHTVEEYRADRTLRQEVFAQCANDPGTLGKTPDCINVQRAMRLESHGSLRDSGPIGLDPQKKTP